MIIRKQDNEQMRSPGSQSSGQSTFQFRRMPAVPRNIAEINPEKDIRIRILGRIIDKYDGTVVVDDGTGKAEIIVEDTNIPFADINSGGFVRVFARVLPLETSYELRAEIVQKLGGEFVDLDKKVRG